MFLFVHLNLSLKNSVIKVFGCYKGTKNYVQRDKRFCNVPRKNYVLFLVFILISRIILMSKITNYKRMATKRDVNNYKWNIL